jgi:hypothetical protein
MGYSEETGKIWNLKFFIGINSIKGNGMEFRGTNLEVVQRARFELADSYEISRMLLGLVLAMKLEEMTRYNRQTSS